MNKTMCWRCNWAYPFEVTKCPNCDAINANFDPEGACEQMDAAEAEQGRIRREYAAEGMER